MNFSPKQCIHHQKKQPREWRLEDQPGEEGIDQNPRLCGEDRRDRSERIRVLWGGGSMGWATPVSLYLSLSSFQWKIDKRSDANLSLPFRWEIDRRSDVDLSLSPCLPSDFTLISFLSLQVPGERKILIGRRLGVSGKSYAGLSQCAGKSGNISSTHETRAEYTWNWPGGGHSRVPIHMDKK